MARGASGTGGGRYHHGDLRRALVSAALEILEEGEEPTLRAVARRVGVSHTAPYHHFPDRRALVAAVAEEGMAAFAEALRAGSAEGDPAARLLGAGVAYVRYAAANPTRFRLMFSAELADRADLPGLQAAYESAYGVLLECVRRLLGGAPEVVVRTRSLAAWSTVHGLAMLILDRQVEGVAATEEEAERITREVLTSAPPAPTGIRPPEG